MTQRNRNARRRPQNQNHYSTELAQRIAAEPTWLKVSFFAIWGFLGWNIGVML